MKDKITFNQDAVPASVIKTAFKTILGSFTAAFLLLCLGGCENPTVDTSSDSSVVSLEQRSSTNCSSEFDLSCTFLGFHVYEYPLPPPSTPGCIGRITLKVFLCPVANGLQYRFEEDNFGLTVFHPNGSPCLIAPGDVEGAYDAAVADFMTDASLALRNVDCDNPEADRAISSLQYRVTCQKICSIEEIQFINEEWITVTRLVWEPCVESPGCCTSTVEWCYIDGVYVPSEPVTTIIAECSGNSIDPGCNGLIGFPGDDEQCAARCE